ncbi:hypothetical protein CKY39_08010 [Variovorax boronicumulans]|uniref:Uncharacterized protein n=1 Tax=Variovorax boronicumulans TaxID=436515 RepID=A0A250DFQ3_9BURK|nr:hypothetical protein [Variovorax boronicumulans]ATA53160.1 hypothetical protein CKY39_08010 [Variovorax boronicumulans]
MNTSLRLLLEDFLGLMREEGELDVFLTLLLSGMGHEIISRAKKGVKQYGVDVSSVGTDKADGRTKLFLWVVKRGDIGRAEWNGSQQSIQYSLDEVVWTYLPSHISPQHAKLPKKVMVLTNGDFHPTLNLAIATTFKTLSRRHGVKFELVNGSILAGWAEEHLLDEHLLPKEARTLLRRMLANISSSETSLQPGRELVAQLTNLATTQDGSENARKKHRLGALRGIRTALSLARSYGLSENNLSVAYKLAEFAVLRTWAALHVEGKQIVYIRDELAALRIQWAAIALEYHERVQPYYQTQDAFASILPDSLLVANRAFEELGRLALQTIFWGNLGAQTGLPVGENLARHSSSQLQVLLETHSCTSSPPYDRHSAVIHATLLALMICNERETAERWLETLIVRLFHATHNKRYWPVDCTFEEALEIREGEKDLTEESSSTSTIIPVFLIWSAALGREDFYSTVRENILPTIPKWTTSNLWSSDSGYDSVVGDAKLLFEHGVAEGLLHVPKTASEFLARLSVPLQGVEPVEQSEWYQQRIPLIPILASLHWGSQVPRMMLIEHAMALCGKSPANYDAAAN